jgi:uncharacterized protein (UPF0335 family)
MGVELKQGTLMVPLVPLLEHLTTTEKREVADTLACMDDIIKDVADQITEGWTDALSHGGLCCTALAEPFNGLDYAKRKVARMAGEVAIEEIKRLENALKDKDREIQNLYKDIQERGRIY